MNLLRILIPSWRFFDHPGTVLELSWRRRAKDGQNWSPWHSCFASKEPTRGLRHLFFNPEGNLYLAERAAVDRLAQELSTASISENQIEDSVSYRVVEGIARRRAPRLENPNSFFQFAIHVRKSPQSEIQQEDIVLISKEGP